MGNFIYFIGGPKDGEIYSSDRPIKPDDLIIVPNIKESTVDALSEPQAETIKQNDIIYRCQVFGFNGVKSLFLVDSKLDQYKVLDKVEEYLAK